MDGCEFPRFFKSLLSAAGQIVMEQVYPEAVFILWYFFQIWLDVAGIEPFHKVRHLKATFQKHETEFVFLL